MSTLPPHPDDTDPFLGYWHLAPPVTPISMRLSRDLAWPVMERQYGRLSAAKVMRRDLERYYAGVRRTLDRLALTRREAELATEVLRHPPSDLPGGRVLAAIVDDWVDRRASDKATRSAATTLVAKLRALGPMECYGVIDGVEVYWAQRYALHEEPADTLLEWALAVSRLTSEYDPEKAQATYLRVFGDSASQEGEDE